MKILWLLLIVFDSRTFGALDHPYPFYR